jgi:serine/threonine-protein kinase
MSALEPRLIPGTGESRTPFFSPDGQWLGWYTTDAIKKIAIAGGEPVHLATVDGPAGASWPEPDTILFADATGIQRISARGGAPERLLAAGNGEQLNAPQLLPNGSLLFSVATGQELDRWDRAQVVVQSPASGTRTVVASKAMEPRYFAEGFITYVLGRSLVAVRFDLDRLAVVGAAVPIVDNVMGPVGVARMLMGGANYDVSPTGTLIYIPDDTPMRSLVWVNRDGTPAGPVAGIPPGYFEDPRLSPDGKRLLVTRDGDLWTYELDSGRESRVTRNGSSLMGVWNPSGTRIAYSSVADGRLEAWVTAADGSGEPRQLTRERTIVHVDSWAPDGRTLSVHRHGTNTIIQMIDVDAPDAKPRVFVDREGPAEGADFVRDGRHVVYLSMDSGRREAYIRPFPGPGGRVTVSVDGGREPRWAANGEVFYRSLDGQRMYVVGTTMSPTLTVGKPQELFRGSYYVTPTGSPRPQYDVTADGRRFVMLVPTPGKAGSGPRIVVVQNWLDELRRLLPADGR